MECHLTCVRVVRDVRECNWSYHDDHEIEDPVRGSGNSVRWCTNVEWRDLSRIQPRLEGDCQHRV